MHACMHSYSPKELLVKNDTVDEVWSRVFVTVLVSVDRPPSEYW